MDSIKGKTMGLLRKIIIILLRIDKWHEYSDKNYVDYTVKVANMILENDKVSSCDEDSCAIEVGCGLGDIVSNIRYKKKIGFDVNKRIVIGAKILHPTVVFKTGSFETIKGKKIKCLIIVNILHFLEPEYVNKNIHELLEDNIVEYIIIDELRNTEGTEYKYEYDGSRLFGCKYRVAYRSRRLKASNGAHRNIVVYGRAN